MPRPCSVCNHDQRREIDKALLNGESYRNVSQQFRVSPAALTRHKPHTAASVEKAHARREVNLGESLLAKLDRLEARLETTYTDSVQLLATAKAAGDTATAVRAVNAIRNVLSESRQQIEVLGELRGELDRRPQINLAVLAPLILQTFAEGGVSTEVRVAVAKRLATLDKTLQLDAAGNIQPA
jgi:hypothetical protein